MVVLNLNIYIKCLIQFIPKAINMYLFFFYFYLFSSGCFTSFSYKLKQASSSLSLLTCRMMGFVVDSPVYPPLLELTVTYMATFQSVMSFHDHHSPNALTPLLSQLIGPRENSDATRLILATGDQFNLDQCIPFIILFCEED